jgi:hypothetical protein
MTCRRLGWLALLAGCGSYDTHPERFTLQLIAPQKYGPVDIDSGNFALQPKDFGGPALDCSLSDPFVALTVESRGCPVWTSFATLDGQPVNTPVATLAPQRKVLTAPLAPGAGRSFRLTGRCVSIFDNPIDIGFPFHAESKGIDFSQLESLDDPVERLLPLPDDQFLAVGHRGVDAIGRDATGAWRGVGGFVYSAEGQARVYVSGTRVVVKDGCDGFACPGDLATVATWMVGTSTLGLTSLSTSTQFLGVLPTGRLAFYHSIDGDSGGAILVWDASAYRKEIPLGHADFPGDTAVLPGVASATGLTYVALDRTALRRIDIDAASESASESDLGTVPTWRAHARLAPDGGAVLYWAFTNDENTACALGLRDARTGTDRWTQPLCPDGAVAPVFLQDLIVVLTADRLVALDAASGAERWSWNRLAAGVAATVTGLEVAGDALIVTTYRVQPRVRVLGADGAQRLDLPLYGTTPTSGFVATSDGALVGAQQRMLYTVQTADAALHAPARVCTRVDCGHGVVDLAVDASNCGQCGRSCAAGETCRGGGCESLPSL